MTENNFKGNGASRRSRPTAAASMRRPSPVKYHGDFSHRGFTRGRQPSCGGSRVLCGVGGTRPPPAFPGGETEKERSSSWLPQAISSPASSSSAPPICFQNCASVASLLLFFNRRFALLPFALFVEPSLRCQLVSSIFDGCCHLGIELLSNHSRLALRSAARSQSPKLGDLL